MINTVQKFLVATSFNRGCNYPTKKSLINQLENLEIEEDLQIEIFTFFLY